jgi:hypothetical protein
MCGRSFASPDRKLKGGNRFQKANAHRTWRARPASFAIQQRCTQEWMYGGITTKEPPSSCCSPGVTLRFRAWNRLFAEQVKWKGELRS